MDKEKEAVKRLSSQGTRKALSTSDDSRGLPRTQITPRSKQAAPHGAKEHGESSEGETHRDTGPQVPEEDRKPPAKEDAPAETVTSESLEAESPRQVIAVSASKGPAAFFNLARKFLVTDEMCDLSALEGAIVSAVDAAHLLERSQLATIVRYVSNVSTTTSMRIAEY
jgi:hypothetical protein